MSLLKRPQECSFYLNLYIPGGIPRKVLAVFSKVPGIKTLWSMISPFYITWNEIQNLSTPAAWQELIVVMETKFQNLI